MAGRLEDESPGQCGEICVFEVFGETVEDGTAAVGIKPIDDPALTGEVEAVPTSIDSTSSASRDVRRS